MKLYKTPSTFPRWHAAKTGLKDFEEVELPKDGRQGMANFLNANEVEADFVKGNNEVDVLEEAERRAIIKSLPEPAAVLAGVNTSRETTDIVDFILNSASVAQAESIFAALGTRFKELARGT